MKNARIFALVFVMIPLLQSCKKSQQICKEKTPQEEEATILAYAASNNINATKDPTGLYYEVIDPGTGAKPSSSSTVKVTYTGKLLNGQVFDQMTSPSATGWVLSTLITGWQVGLPHISQGGSIKLIVPSSMAYGCSAIGSIPSNSILYFEVTLVQVQ